MLIHVCERKKRLGPYLSASKHDDKVDVVTILNGFNQLIRKGTGVVEINFNNIEQFIFFSKERFFHLGELIDEMVQAFSNGIPPNLYHLQAVGKLPMSCMDVYFDRHVLSLSC